jgi:predicted HicB family RNase H-like nuclease
VKGGKHLSERKSRADYFKQRRETRKNFSVLISKERMEMLEKRLAQQGKSKTQWVKEKIDEELSKN